MKTNAEQKIKEQPKALHWTGIPLRVMPASELGRCRAVDKGVEEMKESARYVKIVEWSEADQCYVGSSPGLIYGGCHGDNEREVFDELCRIVEEAITLYKADGKALPPPTSGRDFANKMQQVA